MKIVFQRCLYVLLVLFFIAAFLVINSCGMTYGTMVEEFNAMLKSEDTYDYSQMLTQNYYTIPNNCVLYLEGPENFASYTWYALVGTGKNQKKTVLSSSKNLTYKLPGIFSSGEENILVLSVEDSNGEKHEDRANVIIYSH